MQLTALFGPEHGFTAVALDGEAVPLEYDAQTRANAAIALF